MWWRRRFHYILIDIRYIISYSVVASEAAWNCLHHFVRWFFSVEHYWPFNADPFVTASQVTRQWEKRRGRSAENDWMEIKNVKKHNQQFQSLIKRNKNVKTDVSIFYINVRERTTLNHT